MDRRFGLAKGFDLYDSPFALHRHRQKDPGDIKRLGRDVMDAATHWLERNDRDPFFLFLHFYDLHTPYNVPAAYRERFRGLSGYDSELAYVDDALGAFWKFLEQRQLLSKALVVLTSDHGESLGDHGETTHGYFIYQSTVWVPLIFRWPDSGKKDVAIRVDDPASLIDVAPTILQFLGIARPPQFQGRSLTFQPRNKKEVTSGIYSETLYGYNHFGVAPLRAMRMGRHKYIEAPRPELYDLVADPGETRNLYEDGHSIAVSLRERLLSIHSQPSGGSTRPAEVAGPEELALLRSLGYLNSSGTTTDPSGLRPDPKDRLEEYETYGRALVLASSGRIGESNTLLEGLLHKNPEFLDARMSLGLNKQRQGLHDQAVRDFQLVLRENPSNSIGRLNLAVSYFELRQWADAIREAEAALRIAPHYTRADELLGTIYTRNKEYARAESHFNHILLAAPDDFVAHHNLGVLATMQKRWTEAERHLSTALKLEPANAEVHNSAGSLYLYTGDFTKAAKAFGEAVRLAPKFAWARYNLGLVLDKQGKRGEAAVQFREALAIDPKLQAARQALARIGESN
jgi:tetratricopeptide (TPR) repeat protein